MYIKLDVILMNFAYIILSNERIWIYTVSCLVQDLKTMTRVLISCSDYSVFALQSRDQKHSVFTSAM